MKIEAELLYKGCLKKKYYGSQAVASNACVLLSMAKGLNLRPYKCLYCAGWHLTSKKL